MWHASQDFRFNTRLMRVDVENQWTAIWEYGGVKCSAGHNHDDDLGSVVLVGVRVAGISNASSLGP